MSRPLQAAIAAYSARQVSIGEGAEMAGLPYTAFFEELRRRRIAVLDEGVDLADELSALAERLGNPRLAEAARRLSTPGEP